MLPRTETRTVRCDTVGAACDEGPVALDGATIATADLRIHPFSPSASSSTAVIELRSMASPVSPRRAYGTAQTLSAASPSRRAVGDSTNGVAGDAFLDAYVSTAESSVWFELTIHLSRKED